MSRNDSSNMGRGGSMDSNTPQTGGMGKGAADAGRTRSSNRAGSNNGGRVNNPNRTGTSSSDKGAGSSMSKRNAARSGRAGG
jgi:hypothetical protein